MGKTHLGPTAQKVLLLLLGGLMLGFTRSPRQYSHIVSTVKKQWREIDRRLLTRAVQKLYESKLVHYREHKDGSVEIVLSRDGRRIAMRYDIDKIKIRRPGAWDKKWRVILFDIPEEIKELRDTLRGKLKQLGLAELQKSVFVHPYECRNEIDFVIELYDARRFVRFIEAVHIDNELHLKKKFKIHI